MPKPAARRSPFQWVSAGLTDVGAARSINEDALIENAAAGIWVVADGMGGHAAGDVASKLVVQAFEQISAPSTLAAYVDLVEQRLSDVNDRLLQLSQEQLENQTIGSTVVALLTQDRFAAIIWVGDSRAYRLRDGQLTMLIQEHTQAEELVERGVLAAEDAENHPTFNVLTRAVGAQTPLYVDIEVLEVRQGDLYLLCSDGLNKGVGDHEIIGMLDPADLTGSVTRLVDRAIRNGSRDNVTVLLAYAA
ncbi:MAG: protein phosphatase 2C domain-containing protein [Pseudomonadota bacterium]|nr:protein phosphatase 2C domain-containing protein [Pseudomonadota bacterium]